MTTAATVALVTAALTGTIAWHRGLTLRVRTTLVLACVLLLLGAFLLAAAQGGAEPAAAQSGGGEPAAAQSAGESALRGPQTVRHALLWLLVGWLAVAGGGPLTEVVLRMASGRLFLQSLQDGSWRRPAADARGAAPPPEPVLEPPQVAAAQELRGGAMIGALERLSAVGVLLAGAVEGLAVVVAVKALGRYPELRSAGASERFIIGTLTSLLWAAAAAGTGALLVRGLST